MISPTRYIATAVRAVAPIAAIALVAAVLLFYPPAQNNFYPQCPIREYLHLQCPGCGATRALGALLNGHLVEALHFNALVTLLLPFAAAYGILCYRRFLQRKPLCWPRLPPSTIYAAFAITAIFSVLRNFSLRAF